MTEPSIASEPGAIEDRRWRATGLVISAIALAAVVWWALDQPAPSLPSGPQELAALAAAVLIYGLATLARGERAFWLLRISGAQPVRGDAYGLTVVSYMGNNVLPARGGDAIRVYLQAPRAQTSMRTVIGTLIAERLLDVAVLLTLFVLLAYVVLRGIEAPDATPLTIAAAVLAAIAAAVALTLYLARHRDAVRRLLGFAAPIVAPTRELRGRRGLAMLGLTFVIWALEAGTYLAAAGAVDLGMTPVEALYVVALASVFVLIPSGPGYVGTLDAAILFGARAIGASGAEAVSYLLTVRFVLLVPITIAGFLILVLRYGGLGQVRAHPAGTDPA